MHYPNGKDPSRHQIPYPSLTNPFSKTDNCPGLQSMTAQQVLPTYLTHTSALTFSQEFAPITGMCFHPTHTHSPFIKGADTQL